MQHKLFCVLAFLVFFGQLVRAQSLLEQKKDYTRADTLRGSLRPERTCYDVTFYELNVKIDTATKSLSGSNRIVYRTLENFSTLQLDLYANIGVLHC